MCTTHHALYTAPWLPSSALLSLLPPPPADLRGSHAIPRLHRGGVRPPESLLGGLGQDITMLRTEPPVASAATCSMALYRRCGTETHQSPWTKTCAFFQFRTMSHVAIYAIWLWYICRHLEHRWVPSANSFRSHGVFLSRCAPFFAPFFP